MLKCIMNFKNPKLPSNKKFGFFFSAVFTILTCYLFIYSISLFAFISAFLGIVIIALTIFRSHYLLPFNKLWMKFGILIGLVVSPLVLGILFFLIFTPIALFFKLIGRDELNLKLNSKNSFWKKRDATEVSANSFRQQF